MCSIIEVIKRDSLLLMASLAWHLIPYSVSIQETHFCLTVAAQCAARDLAKHQDHYLYRLDVGLSAAVIIFYPIEGQNPCIL